MPIGVTREKLVAVDKVEKRHRFTPQSVDHMAIIDDMRVLAGRGGSPACQSHQRRSTNEQIQAVIVKSDPQPVSDEPRRHRVEYLPEREAAGRSNGDDRLLIIACTLTRQR